MASTDEARVQQLLPMTRQAKPVPNSGGRLEAFSADGELVYWVSRERGWTVVTIADKASSEQNVRARAKSDERFAQPNRKFDKLIETAEAAQGKH